MSGENGPVNRSAVCGLKPGPFEYEAGQGQWVMCKRRGEELRTGTFVGAENTKLEGIVWKLLGDVSLTVTLHIQGHRSYTGCCTENSHKLDTLCLTHLTEHETRGSANMHWLSVSPLFAIRELSLGSYDRASWAKYEEGRPTRCNN